MIGLPSTVMRVPRHTSRRVNQAIEREMVRRLRHFAARVEQIERRLRQLDREWDIERALESNASALALVGLVLGETVDRRFNILPATVFAFLLQHALQGWCPPVPILRRAGFRTHREIDTERIALKILRGDFEDCRPSPNVEGSVETDRAVDAALEALRR